MCIPPAFLELLFDGLNEALAYFRPFDLRGVSFPWVTDSKNLCFTKIDQQNQSVVF